MRRPVALTFVPAALAPPPVPWPPVEDPSLARVLEIVSSDRGLVVVTELALGPTLEALMAFPEPPQLVALLVAQALEGLAALHREGRAHGSLSPDAWVLDARTHRVRMVDLWTTWMPVQPSGGHRLYSAPELWERTSPATEEERMRGDVYAVSRLAEALLRGGPPMGGWLPLLPHPRLTDDGRRSFTAMAGWIARCQATAPSERPADAMAALEAFPPAPSEGQAALARAVASMRYPYLAHIERELKRFAQIPTPQVEAEDIGYLGAISSLQASFLWKAVTIAGVLALAASVGFARSPRRQASGGWTAAACLEDAKPGIPQGPDAGDQTLVRFTGATPELLAIDGCPVPRPEDSAGGRFVLTPGVHQLRAEIGGRKVAEAFQLDGGAELELNVEHLPVATETGAEDIATFRREFGKLTERAAAERLGAEAQPGPHEPEGPSSALEQSLVDPLVRDLLALDQRYVASSLAVKANLPDGLALWLDGVRASASRLSDGEHECLRRAEEQVKVLLAQRQPGAEPDLALAVEELSIGRLLASQQKEPTLDEAAALRSLGVPDSPMLERAVDDLAHDAELRRCIEALRPRASDLQALAASQLSEFGEWAAWAREPSAPPAPAQQAD